MNIARILYPVEVLGPGKRIGIWLAGCPHHCPNCCNPELWEQRPEFEISVEAIFDFVQQIAAQRQVDGITISGGDPFSQAGQLSKLLDKLNILTEDILVYTGYTISELQSSQNPDIQDCLDRIAVLIDGRYEESLNDGAPLRGSSNQQVIVLRESVADLYSSYMKSIPAHTMQNFISNDGIISVGIPRAGFKHDFESTIQKRGIHFDGD